MQNQNALLRTHLKMEFLKRESLKPSVVTSTILPRPLSPSQQVKKTASGKLELEKKHSSKMLLTKTNERTKPFVSAAAAMK